MNLGVAALKGGAIAVSDTGNHRICLLREGVVTELAGGTEGKRLTLEWRGGREVEWCGLLRPDVVAATRLRLLVTHARLAA